MTYHEGLDVGLSLTGLSVGVLEGCETNKEKSNACVS